MDGITLTDYESNLVKAALHDRSQWLFSQARKWEQGKCPCSADPGMPCAAGHVDLHAPLRRTLLGEARELAELAGLIGKFQ